MSRHVTYDTRGTALQTDRMIRCSCSLSCLPKVFYLLSLENMDVRVRSMVMAMASLSAMLAGGRKSASQEMVRKTVETM